MRIPPVLALTALAQAGCSVLPGPTTAPPGFAFLRRERFSSGGQTHVVELFLHQRTGLEFVLVPGGEFVMGCPEQGGASPRLPVPPFLLCRTEATQEAWDRLGGADARHWRGPSLPIERVSWGDAVDWCARAGLRLPTEAEWEYACRAGTTGRFHFGESEQDLDRHAWFDANSGWRTRPVAQKHPNAFGLLDMHGNVLEWCLDAWEGPGTPAGARVIRGGCWCYRPAACRSAFRHWAEPSFRGRILGFRPAATLE